MWFTFISKYSEIFTHMPFNYARNSRLGMIDIATELADIPTGLTYRVETTGSYEWRCKKQRDAGRGVYFRLKPESGWLVWASARVALRQVSFTNAHSRIAIGWPGSWPLSNLSSITGLHVNQICNTLGILRSVYALFALNLEAEKWKNVWS